MTTPKPKILIILLIFLAGCSSSICVDLAEEYCYKNTINNYDNLSMESLRYYSHCINIQRLPVMVGGC